MVSPDILGASSGAGLGAAIAILLSLPYVFIQLNAFVFGIAAVGIAYFICQRVSRGKDAVLMLVLGGMIVSTLFSSFITLAKYIADPESKLPEITYWLMGGLSTVSLQDVLVLVASLLVGALPLAVMRWQLNAMAFGDEEASAMGMNVKGLRAIFILCATLLTAASVSVAGMIGWIGLIIPHMARFIVGRRRCSNRCSGSFPSRREGSTSTGGSSISATESAWPRLSATSPRFTSRRFRSSSSTWW